MRAQLEAGLGSVAYMSEKIVCNKCETANYVNMNKHKHRSVYCKQCKAVLIERKPPERLLITSEAAEALSLIIKERKVEVSALLERVKYATICPKCRAQNPQNSRKALERPEGFETDFEPWACSKCGHRWGKNV